MPVDNKLKSILDDVLSLDGRAQGFLADTPLLGAIVELDSMAVVTLIAAIEEQFEVEIADDELDGAVFATFGSLLAFVSQLKSR